MPEHAASQDHFLSTRVYDVTKFGAQIFLPAVGTLYFALAQIWGLPSGEAVVGTIVAVDAFLGLLLGYSTKSYDNSEAKYDGVIDVEDQGEGESKMFSLNLNSDPEDLEGKKEVLFKVNPS